MLLAIREQAKGWIAWVVIILIGAAFALFGLSSYVTPSGSERALAVVNSQEINPDAVSRLYQQQRRQIEQMLGERFDSSMINEQELRLNALNQVIDEYLLAGYIESRRLRLSDRDLAALIRSLEMFQEDGRFSSALYRQLLEANRMSIPQYEAQVRQSALMEQIQDAVGGTAVATQRDVDQLIALQQQQRDVSYLTLGVDDFRNANAVSDEDLQDYYNANRSRFMSQEQVKLLWVELTRDALLETIEITEDDLRNRYDELVVSRFSEPEVRTVRHILVQLEQNAGEDAVDQARERIAQLRSRIDGGESFADVAQAESDDPSSASQGGELGALERGFMVEAFDAAAFTLEQGALSEPVRTRFGFHLIQVTGVRGGERQPFAEVRDMLARELAQERVDNLFFERSSELGQLAFEWPDSLEEAADSLDLAVQSSDWIPRSGSVSGIGSHPEVVRAAMSPPVLEDGYNSELIELDGRYVVIRVAEHQTPEQLSFEDVADSIREQLVTQRAEQAAEARADELLASLRDGSSSLEELVAGEPGLSLETLGFIDRTASLPRQVIRQAFEMERPAAEQRSAGLVRLVDSGDFALVVVSEVRDGDASAVSDEERRQLREQLRTAYGQGAMRDFIRQLRAEADIEIFEDRLETR